MPMWSVYAPADAYTPQDKQAFATAISQLYVDDVKIPRFYVDVVFIDLLPGQFFVGGEPRDNFVRISIDHIAVATPPDFSRWWMTKVAQTVAPWIADRGYGWEVHVDETPLRLWTIQGFFPPERGSAQEARWIRDNKPSRPAAEAPASQ